MWKATAKSGGVGKSKWVVKGADKEDDGCATEAAESAQENTYDRSTMLRFLDGSSMAGISSRRKKLEAGASKEELSPPEGESEEPPLGYQMSVTDRSTDEGKDGNRITKRSLRLEKKAQKAENELRRAQSESFDGQEVLPSQEIELSKELQATSASQMAYNSYLMSYLNGMYAMAPMYAGAYAGATTVMLRNIPNRYTRDMLVERLNQGYEGKYDFVYLPIDFNSKCNVGYAFINFREPVQAQRFIQEFHGARTKICLPGFGSAKVCEVSYARVQGSQANMDNLRDEKFIEKLNERPDWQPLYLDNEGKEIPFSSTLGTVGKKRHSSSAQPPPPPLSPGMSPGMVPPPPPTPLSPTAMSPGGFMPYGPYGMFPPFAMPPAPTTTLSSILPDASPGTTLMLRGVPTSWDRNQLVNQLTSYSGTYDFLYLPGDGKGEGNRGFCFVNFRFKTKAEAFTKEYHQAKVKDLFTGFDAPDDKVCEVEVARFAQIEKSIERLQMGGASKGGGASPSARSAWQPLLFAADGKPLPFPLLASPAPQAMGFGFPPGSPASAKVKAKAGKDRRAGAAKQEPATAEVSVAEEATAPESKSTAAAEGGILEASSAATPSASSEAAPPTKAPKASPAAGSTAKSKGGKTPKGASGGSTPKGAAGYHTGLPGSPYGAAGFPGFGYPGMPALPGAVQNNAYAAAAQMAHHAAVTRAMQAAHMTAHAAAAAHAGHPAGGHAGAAAVPSGPGSGSAEEKRSKLRKQVEFYFSTGNLCKDLFLRRHMTSDGWVSLELIAGFPQVQRYMVQATGIAEALVDSSVVELDAEKRRMRLKDEEARAKWARVPDEAATGTAGVS